jgi:hypothetical protein
MLPTLVLPQQVAVGIAVHQATRSKKIVQILHGVGISMEYNPLLWYETEMAESVIRNASDKVYVLQELIKNRHVDFLEDTPQQ